MAGTSGYVALTGAQRQARYRATEKGVAAAARQAAHLATDEGRSYLARYHAQRRAWIDAYKVKAGCADCGYNLHPEALDFDHLPGTVKRFGIGAASTRSWTKVEAEIAKCEVVCANCHRHRTKTRRR